MNKYTQPHIANSALVTIDTQNDFTLSDAPLRIAGTEEIIPEMVRLLNLYRRKSLPIIHVVRLYLHDGSNAELCRRHIIEAGKGLLAPGSEGAELIQKLKPRGSVRIDSQQLLDGKFQPIGEHEFVMYKPRWGAFYGTQLEYFLKTLGVDTLVFTGCNFPNCPRTSIYEASERDFRIVLIKDAISQLYEKGEEEMANIGVNLMTTDELIGLA